VPVEESPAKTEMVDRGLPSGAGENRRQPAIIFMSLILPFLNRFSVLFYMEQDASWTFSGTGG